MKLIDVKYTRAERLTADEKRELGIDPKIKSGLIAIEILENIEKTDSPKNIIRRGVVIDSYTKYLDSRVKHLIAEFPIKLEERIWAK